MLNIHSKLKSLEKLIGNTPLVEITCVYNGTEIKIYSKLEYYNRSYKWKYWDFFQFNWYLFRS